MDIREATKKLLGLPTDEDILREKKRMEERNEAMKRYTQMMEEGLV